MVSEDSYLYYCWFHRKFLCFFHSNYRFSNSLCLFVYIKQRVILHRVTGNIAKLSHHWRIRLHTDGSLRLCNLGVADIGISV